MLLGRDVERRAIDALLGAAREGISGALIVSGEPGVGKTALLDYAAASASDLRVLRVGGIESEAELPFASLHALLRPVMDRMAALPPPQRRALSVALGLADGGGDRFMVGAGVLSLLAEVADDGPVLCLIDDVRWMDHGSVEALAFAARRLHREGIVVLFAARDREYGAARDHEYSPARDAGPAVHDNPAVLLSAGIPETRLTGLDDASAAALLGGGGTDLSPTLRAQLVTETHGNPLALLELAPLVAEKGLSGGPIPLTDRVREAFGRHIRLLPASGRVLLLLAAADDTGDLGLLLRAGESLGVGIADVALAGASALISVTDGTFTFRHPLVRAAAYHGASLEQRVAAHTALATAYGESLDSDRRAWHRALATVGADESTASEVEQVGDRAAARNDHAAASVAYERAAGLSPNSEDAARRIALACEAGLRGGQPGRVRPWAERALPRVTQPAIRSRLMESLASCEFARGELRRAHQLFCSAARLAPEERERVVWLALRALHAAWASPTDEKLVSEALTLFEAVNFPSAAPQSAVAWLARWGIAAGLGWDSTTFPELDGLIEQARTVGAVAGPRGLVEVVGRVLVTGRDDTAAEIAGELIAAARAGGAVSALPAGLGYLALAQVWLGRPHEALTSGTEAVTIARDVGQPLWVSYASGALAQLAAVQGDDEACRRHAELADGAGGSAPGAQGGMTLAQTALGLLDLGHGRMRPAFDQLCAVLHGPTRHQLAAVRCVPDVVEAAVRLGEPGSAAGPLATFSTWAGTVRQPWADALLSRCRAMMAPDTGAEPHFVRALEAHTRQLRPFDRARTELVYGEWLRRARRKNEAQARLRAALRGFEELGSTPWAARARAELNAAGASVAPERAPDVFAALTPQELHIAKLAAGGLSNRDIAARLYLSPRTVAYHLYKAYPKLGVGSRGELAALTSSTHGD